MAGAVVIAWPVRKTVIDHPAGTRAERRPFVAVRIQPRQAGRVLVEHVVDAHRNRCVAVAEQSGEHLVVLGVDHVPGFDDAVVALVVAIFVDVPELGGQAAVAPGVCCPHMGAQLRQGREVVAEVPAARAVEADRPVADRELRHVGRRRAEEQVARADIDVPGQIHVKPAGFDRADIDELGIDLAQLAAGVADDSRIVRYAVVQAVVVDDRLGAFGLCDQVLVVEVEVIHARVEAVLQLQHQAQVEVLRFLGRQVRRTLHRHGDVVVQTCRNAHRAAAGTGRRSRVVDEGRRSRFGGLAHRGRLEGSAPGAAESEPVERTEFEGYLRVRGGADPAAVIFPAHGELQLKGVGHGHDDFAEYGDHVLAAHYRAGEALFVGLAGGFQRVAEDLNLHVAKLGAESRLHRIAVEVEQVAGKHQVGDLFQHSGITCRRRVELGQRDVAVAGRARAVLGRNQRRIGQARAEGIPFARFHQILEYVGTIVVRRVRGARGVRPAVGKVHAPGVADIEFHAVEDARVGQFPLDVLGQGRVVHLPAQRSGGHLQVGRGVDRVVPLFRADIENVRRIGGVGDKEVERMRSRNRPAPADRSARIESGAAARPLDDVVGIARFRVIAQPVAEFPFELVEHLHPLFGGNDRHLVYEQVAAA